MEAPPARHHHGVSSISGATRVHGEGHRGAWERDARGLGAALACPAFVGLDWVALHPNEKVVT